MHNNFELVVVGGGAAGFMGAIQAAQEGIASVMILEASSKYLEKVRISGGGRCNITHACWDPADLTFNYPRGKAPLIGAFNHFATGDAVTWFENRGLDLKIESDGRIFPKSNSSNDVVRCLQNEAIKAGVVSSTRKVVKNIKFLGDKGFLLNCRCGSVIRAKKILLATGGDPRGKKLAASLGHKVIPPAPSIFSLNITDFSFDNCAGISIDNVELNLNIRGKSFKQKGRVLFTHRGLSGPAILRLSAFAARNLLDSNYSALLKINWLSSSEPLILE